ncbi:hypothetical protein IPZ55_20890 [Streptomyces sp. A10(2020)]|uniref:hypothetical protein n=1 Tax=Streptomyces sp. A10(2020) TaxID=2782013 RepID=UPI001F5C8E56|nr:hypothetical protein [Streptomyces sp. A10(2020)]UNR58836.1 hypothetical protein IPZ55_20890 [Streptomyces sp. A10(2020)]
MAELVVQVVLDDADPGLRPLDDGGAPGLLHVGEEVGAELLEFGLCLLLAGVDAGDLAGDLAHLFPEVGDEVADLLESAVQEGVHLVHADAPIREAAR